MSVQHAEPWSSGLCDCFSDVNNCCITFWCPCITFGQIAEIVDKGSTSCGVHGTLYGLLYVCTGWQCIYSGFYRKKLRMQYMIEGSCCGDCLTSCCCEWCALCQEYRQLKHLGYDMDLGWQGDVCVNKQNQGVTTAPAAQEEMQR